MELIFQSFCLIDEENLDTLNDLRKAQLDLAGKLSYGEEVNYETALYETYEGNCEFWEVFDTQALDTPLYDVWVFDVDTAVVFFAGTTTDTGVGMIQASFDPIETKNNTPENQLLAQALEKAFFERDMPEYLDEDGPAQAYEKAVKEIKKNLGMNNDATN
jgi:hypothetical protein